MWKRICERKAGTVRTEAEDRLLGKIGGGSGITCTSPPHTGYFCREGIPKTDFVFISGRDPLRVGGNGHGSD